MQYRGKSAMKKLFKFGCGSIAALFILVIIIGVFGETDNQTSEKETNNTSEVKQETIDKQPQESQIQEKEEKKEVGIGEELTVGDVIFKVNSMKEVSSISAADGFMKYTPDAEGAVFLKINVTVKNNGSEMIQTDSGYFKLISSDGTEYSPSTIIVADENYFTFEGINPGLALTGNVVFEVPKGLTGLDLRVQTGFWGTKTGLIRLN